MRTIHCMRALISGLVLGLLLQLAGSRANAAPTGSDADWIYRIQPGDSLQSLSDSLLEPEYGWRDLQRHNRINDPLRLVPGRSLRMPLAWLRREASVARAIHVQGDVQLKRGALTTTLETGAELRAGDSLISGRQGSASLRFADGSRLLISPGSSLSIEQLLIHGRSAIPAMQLRLEQGSIENRVLPNAAQPPRYEIRSPSLNLGVRGTEFRVQADAASSRAQVLEGRVAALQEAGRELSIQAGFGAVATPGQATPSLQPLLPAPELSQLPARIERLPVQLSWPALAGARAYRAQVFAAGSDEQLMAEAVVEGSSAQLHGMPELPDGPYRLRLRGIDGRGLEGLSAEAGFTLKARPEPPFLQAPGAAAALYGEPTRFAWTRALAAQRYRLQVSADPEFKQPLFDQDSLSAIEHSLSLPPGSYYWRLASIARKPDGSTDPGPFSEVQQFTLRPLPPSPALEPPELGDRLVFRWRAQPGMSYQLQLATDAEFKTGLKEWGSSEAQTSLDRPSPGRYYLRVRSVDSHGQAGAWGGTQQIDVPYSRWLWLLLPLGLLLVGL